MCVCIYIYVRVYILVIPSENPHQIKMQKQRNEGAFNDHRSQLSHRTNKVSPKKAGN